MKSRARARVDRRAALAILLAAFLGAVAGVRGAPLPENDSGPVSLFDGNDLAGWVEVPAPAPGKAGIWSVRNGVIQCLGSPKGYLRTARAYRNYRLRVQWRWQGKPGNSGIFVHGSGPDKVWPQCYEAQLKAGNAGEIRANGGSKFHDDSAPADRSMPKLAASSEHQPGEWNDYEITCRGSTVELRVNGVLQNRLEQATLQSGWIALQSEGEIIEFRAITLEPLSAPPDPEPIPK